MATYLVTRRSINSWIENDPITIEADTLQAAKRKAWGLREDGMNLILADANGRALCARRWIECNDSWHNHFGAWRDCPAF